MAKKNEMGQFELDKPIEEMSLEEIERATKLVALQAQMLQLDEVREANRKRIEKKAAVERFNKQLQEDVRAEKAALAAGQRICRHRSGGFHTNIYRGNKEPTVFRTLMPDGFTYFIQCVRCRFQMYTPHPDLEKTNPKVYAEQMKLYEKMYELTEERAMDEIQTPNFIFRKNGVQFIPQRA